jgi:hypothetical protein
MIGRKSEIEINRQKEKQKVGKREIEKKSERKEKVRNMEETKDRKE